MDAENMNIPNQGEPTRHVNRNNNNIHKERIMQSAHGKESSGASTSGGNSNSGGGFANTYVAATTATATTTTTVAATTTTTTTATTSATTTEEVHEQEAHIEAPEIETPAVIEEQPAPAAPAQTSYTRSGAATTFALFSDPNRFSPQSISNTLQHISDNLGGRAWLDMDGNGKRGSESDSTLNAAEWDNGVGGVQVQLVECESDTPLFAKTSLPNNGVGDKGSTVKKSDLEEAGLYNFPLEASDIPIGRYYLLYRAPSNYRLSGNTLPLSRQETEDGALYFDCIPKGGEGDDFLETVQDSGDLDQGGYCARSIGCFEVSPHFNLDKDFESLDYLSGSVEDYTGTFQNLVAMPSESYFNVGLSEEVWPLGTYQFADSTITLRFPKSVNEEMLGSAVPKDFGKSDVKKSLEDAIARKIVRELGEFALQGVEVNGGFVVPAASNRKKKRGLLRRRGLQEEEDSEGEASITYTLTTRGSYSPPPRVQLGDIMQESINSDPQGLTKSLKDKEGLPPVFEEVEEIKSRHLTVKTKTEHLPGLEAILDAQEADPAFAKWAIVPILLCLLGIFGLVGLFLFRRVFVRRVKPGTKHNDGIKIFLNGGGTVKKAFVRSKYNPDDEKKKKKRRGYNDDDDDDYTRDHHMMGNEESTGSSEEGYEHRESRRDRSNRSRDAFSSSMGSHSHNSSGNTSTVAKSTRSARAERRNRRNRSHKSSRDDEQPRSTRSSQRKSKRKPVGDRPID